MPANGKVDLQNLRKACQDMVELIDTISNPEIDSSGARNFGFPMIANEIRFELDGSESCIPSVRERAALSDSALRPLALGDVLAGITEA